MAFQLDQALCSSLRMDKCMNMMSAANGTSNLNEYSLGELEKRWKQESISSCYGSNIAKMNKNINEFYTVWTAYSVWNIIILQKFILWSDACEYSKGEQHRT